MKKKRNFGVNVIKLELNYVSFELIYSPVRKIMIRFVKEGPQSTKFWELKLPSTQLYEVYQ